MKSRRINDIMKTFLVFFLTILAHSSFSQYLSDFNYIGNTERYLKDTIQTTFSSQFNTDQKKKDFKELREFLAEKENLLQALKDTQLNLSGKINWTDTAQLSTLVKQLNNLLKKKGGTGTFEVPPSLLRQYYYLEDQYSEEYTSTYMRDTEYVNGVIERYQKEIVRIIKISKQIATLEQNIKNVKQDIYDCRNEIDSALAPEYKQQEFRITISICFAALIGILLIVFFYIVFKRSDSTLSKELLSGSGLQFVTLFVLIIAIVLFGILNILQGSELAAILSGISGYILGKGTQTAKPESDHG